MTEWLCPVCCNATATPGSGEPGSARLCTACGFEALSVACVRVERLAPRATIGDAIRGVCVEGVDAPTFHRFALFYLTVDLQDRHGRTLLGGGTAWHIFDDRHPAAGLNISRAWQFEAFRRGARVVGFGRSVVAALQSLIVPGHVPGEIAGVAGCGCDMCALGVEGYRAARFDGGG